MDTAREEAMDYSGQLDDLQKRAAQAKASVQAAATESRDQLELCQFLNATHEDRMSNYIPFGG
jgi:hypothetical protein